MLDTSEYRAIIIDQVQCTALMRMSAPIGGKLPMHASGAGKAFLATLPDDQVTKLLHKKGMHTYTPHTLTPHNLKEGLAQIRKQGFSLTTKSTRSACAAWLPVSSTSTAKPSPPSPSPARCRASPTIA